MKYKLAANVRHLARGPWHLFFRDETLAWAVTDDVGASILAALTGFEDAEELAMEIATKTSSSLAEVAIEVRHFLGVLQKEGIVEEPEKAALLHPAVCPTKPKPGSLYLHLTARCNLRCAYCYNQPLRERESWGRDLSYELALQTLHQAKELGIATVFLTGGEPLLHPRVMEIAEVAHDHGLRTVLLTKGLFIDDHAAKSLAQCCDQITVSFDSAVPALHDLRRGPGSHKRVVKAVRRLKAAG